MTTSVGDYDAHDDGLIFSIDVETRQIDVPSGGEILGCKLDKNANYVNFRIPRLYNGVDFLDCTPRINYRNVEGTEAFYDSTDYMEKTDDDGTVYIYFSWKIGSLVTKSPGNVSFSVSMIKKQNESVVIRFSSALATGTVIDSIIAGGTGDTFGIPLASSEEEGF